MLVLSLDRQFYRDDHLFVHLRHQVVMLDGATVTLTRTEYRLLALLAQYAGEVVPRPILLTQLWGYLPAPHTRLLEPHIRHLREKLGVYADQYIETVPKVGYRFRPAVLTGHV